MALHRKWVWPYLDTTDHFGVPVLLTSGNTAFQRYICSAQSGNLCNLEIVLRILRIPKLRANLEIAHWRGTSVQSQDRAAPVRNLELA